MGALHEMPLFTPAESAWIFVPYRRTTAWRMLVSGGILVTLAATNLARGGGLAPVLHWAVAAAGVLLLLGAIGGLVRRGPVLTADSDGITATYAGFDRSHLPWSMIIGAEVAGRKTERALAILVRDPEGALAMGSPAVAPMVRKFNQKHAVAGGLLVLTRIMGRPADEVAEQIRALVADLAPEIEAGPDEGGATSPAGASRSSRPA